MHWLLNISPKPLPRPRVTRRGVFYPKSYKDWRHKIQDMLVENLKERGFSETQSPLYDRAFPLMIDYTFVFKRPKYMHSDRYPKIRIHHTKRPDLDNCIKSVNDALVGAKVLIDDSIIVGTTATKMYAAVGEEPSVSIQVSFISNVFHL